MTLNSSRRTQKPQNKFIDIVQCHDPVITITFEPRTDGKNNSESHGNHDSHDY